MLRKVSLLSAPVLACLMIAALLAGCPEPVMTPADGADTETGGDTGSGTETDTETGSGDETTSGGGTEVVPGVLKVQALAQSLGSSARLVASGQDAPDDVDVNLTPTEYTIAFKRLVLKEVDEASEETLTEVEIFSAETVDDALIVDLLDTAASDVLDVEDLTAGTYNQLDIEVFYLEMTVPTIYPDETSHDISYRMIYEDMDLLLERDFLLYLEPDWMEPNSVLAASVTEEGWYWIEMSDPDNAVAVEGAAVRPDFHVLDLFADEDFWSSEHKVLEGGHIAPPLEFDPNDGGVLTISFDVTGKFNFKDYYDDTTSADGLWEIRCDDGIHPFPPHIGCAPEDAEDGEPEDAEPAD